MDKKPYALLPLGSVVLLNGGTKKLMIVGRLQVNPDADRVFDYAAVLWPEGLVDASSFYLFDQENIQSICFMGCQSEEENAFLEHLSQAIPAQMS